MSDLLRAISAVTDLAELDAIADAARDRRKALAKLAATELRRGDRFLVGERITPRYLAGLPVTFVRKNDATVVVDVPEGDEYRRFSGAKGVKLPNSLIGEKVA